MDPVQESGLYKHFANIVGIVFNNWTAMKLAVEHGMAGPPASTRQKLAATVETAAELLYSGTADWGELSDFLAETMDSEFSTVLEDGSSDSVASHLCQLYRMFSSGDVQSLVLALEPLPCKSPIHLGPQPELRPSPEREEQKESPPQEPQEEGWTLVKKK
ncbi:pre-rRNA-processing protein TSR2 homolog [Homalodisca vitripennis]|uniref:pre-rRNA-processing protein TSR2 homolog n=1 Tax=Homalodisca vitripennis TaxID=197043 RepID=UPI001EEB222B|nr:pre-rRNA-processing protein TSR2 homolog [Homalodisca vitripennis]